MFYLFSVCVYIHMYSHGLSITYMWRSDNNLEVFTFYHVILGVSGLQAWQQAHLPSELFCKPVPEIFIEKRSLVTI